MAIIFPFILILIISLFFTIIFRKKIEETIAFTTLGITILIYLLGLFYDLLIGYYAVIFITVVCIVLIIINYKRIVVKNIVTPGLLFFTIIFGMAIYMNQFIYAETWDESAHWALTVKNMFMLDQLSTAAQSNVIYRDYAPGTAVFHYFWVRSSSVFDERLLYVSMDVLIGGFLCNTLRDYTFKDWRKLTLIFPILFLAPLSIYSYAYTGIFVEPILGILFAFVIFVYFSYGLNNYSMLIISLALFLLVLIKSTGLIFACITLLIMGIDLLIVKRKNTWNLIKNKKNIIKKILFVIMTLSPFLADLSWKMNLAQNQILPTWNIDASTMWNDILNYQNMLQYKIDGIKNFIKSFFNLNTSWNSAVAINFLKVPFIVLLSMIAFLMYGLCRFYKKNKSLSVALILLFITNILYTLSTLFLAVSQFSEGEISNFYASNRYSLTFVLAIFILIVFLLIKYAANKKWDKSFVFIGIAFLLMFNMNNFYRINPMTNYEKYVIRQSIKSTNNEVVEYIGYDYRLLVYGSASYLILDCAPMKITPLSSDFSFIETNYTNFDYLYFNNIESIILTDEWKMKFEHLFSDKNSIYDHTIYKVVDNNGTLLLDYVATIEYKE